MIFHNVKNAKHRDGDVEKFERFERFIFTLEIKNIKHQVLVQKFNGVMTNLRF